MYEKTLIQLKNAIKENNSPKVAFFAGTLINKSLDSEYLNMAIDTGTPAIVASISAQTQEKEFDKKVLMKAINSKDQKITKMIVPKTSERYFDKDTLKSSILTENGEITKQVASKTNPAFFDEGILNLALRSQVPDSVRAVVDKVEDMSLLIKNKGNIQNGILRAEDLKNLAGQMLSRSHNQSCDRELQDVVFDIYLDVILSHITSGNISQNFPMKSFQDSIKESTYFAYYPTKINFDSLDKPNSFLILPVYSYGHAFSAVIKKETESDNISVTFVNLGARPFEMSGNGNQYKEYVYTPEIAKQILKSFCYNVRVDYPDMAVSTDQAYKKFKKYALAEYSVNVTSRNQKVGNCFTKNIEKGLRYALALGLSKIEDPEFKQDSLRVIKQNSQKKKVKFLKPIFNEGDITNELTTVQLKKELINSMIKRFPQYKNEILEEWNIYKDRKEKSTDDSPRVLHSHDMKRHNNKYIFQNKSNYLNKKDHFTVYR